MVALSLAFALLAAAPPPAAPDLLEALGFDNGTVLLSETGSYGTGIGAWSAWRLTDGDEKTGWCSAQGQATGSAFVWELDTTWELRTFSVSTRYMQESEYPGISARSVELHLADGGSWRKAGSFQIGKGERKEFPLPAATRARQVKLVVTGNHGNAEYSEIAEVGLLGTRAGTVATSRVAGSYATNYGPMRFVQEGDEVYGCYDWAERSLVWGAVQGRNVRVTWLEESGETVRQGTATFAVTSDGKTLWGVWFEGGSLAGVWSGERVPESQGPKCIPKKKGQLQTALQRQGRAVLYGIRFDSNSDVPRPESGATLDEVATLLKEEAKLRLLVEGHTDSTNTDAYNLDLSARRARKVVDLLVQRGADPSRVQSQGFGRTRPVADNATAQGRALNRRVEVSVAK